MEGELWTDVHIYVVWSMRKSLANKTYVYSSLNIFQKAHINYYYQLFYRTQQCQHLNCLVCANGSVVNHDSTITTCCPRLSLSFSI